MLQVHISHNSFPLFDLQEEEVRDGIKFYRWIDTAEYEVFRAMMQRYFEGRKANESPTPASMILRDVISERMVEGN
jgi:hypothetical protein